MSRLPANSGLTSNREVDPRAIATGQLPFTVRVPIRCCQCRARTIYVLRETTICWHCHMVSRRRRAREVRS